MTMTTATTAIMHRQDQRDLQHAQAAGAHAVDGLHEPVREAPGCSRR